MKSAILFATLLSTLTLTACGPSKEELERQRLEEEAKKQIEFNTDINNAFIKGFADPNDGNNKEERERQETYESISSPDSRMIIGAPDNTEEKQEKE